MAKYVQIYSFGPTEQWLSGLVHTGLRYTFTYNVLRAYS